MGFVQLPESIAVAQLAGARGRQRSVTVNVFAGEVVEARAMPRHSVLVLDDGPQVRNFDLDALTIDLRPGDLAAVASIAPRRRKAGPIVAIANLDRDQKEEFIGREREMLRHIGGWRRDYRSSRALWRSAGLGAVKAAAVGGAAWLALAAVLEGWIALPPAASDVAFNLSQGGAPLVLGLLTLPYLLGAALFRVRARSRAQDALVNDIWRAVGAALAHARHASQPPVPALPAPTAEDWQLGGVDLDYARAG